MALYGFSTHISSIINRLGRPVTLRQISQSGPAYNPTLINTDVTITATSFDYTKEEINGSIIQEGDKQFVVASSQVIKKQDKILDDGVQYHIIDLELVRPGGSVLLYLIQGRE